MDQKSPDLLSSLGLKLQKPDVTWWSRRISSPTAFHVVMWVQRKCWPVLHQYLTGISFVSHWYFISISPGTIDRTFCRRSILHLSGSGTTWGVQNWQWRCRGFGTRRNGNHKRQGSKLSLKCALPLETLDLYTMFQRIKFHWLRDPWHMLIQ